MASTAHLRENKMAMDYMFELGDYYKMRVDDEENAESMDMAVQDQVLYLTNLMRQRRSTALHDVVGSDNLNMLALMSNDSSQTVPLSHQNSLERPDLLSHRFI